MVPATGSGPIAATDIGIGISIPGDRHHGRGHPHAAIRQLFPGSAADPPQPLAAGPNVDYHAWSGEVPMAIAFGVLPTVTSATTELVAVSITKTLSATSSNGAPWELEPGFVTYARRPSAVNATQRGVCPTSTVADTVLVAVSITETLLER